MELLQKINSPEDLRRLRPEQLQEVANDIRQYILETMSRIGGHTGASLGAVELAVALHYAFDTPRDRLVWDVGHQAYAHKILTGRRDLLPTIKQYGGLSGFLRRDESEFDTFGAGHASTSLSAALGMAVARDEKGFVLTGNACRAHSGGTVSAPLQTNVPGVFAVGDVRSGSVKRVAAGVGEGSVVVHAIHRFLHPSPV